MHRESAERLQAPGTVAGARSTAVGADNSGDSLSPADAPAADASSAPAATGAAADGTATIMDAASAAAAVPVPKVDGVRARQQPSFVALAAAAALASTAASSSSSSSSSSLYGGGPGAGTVDGSDGSFNPQVGVLGGGGTGPYSSRPSTSNTISVSAAAARSGVAHIPPVPSNAAAYDRRPRAAATATPAALMRDAQRTAMRTTGPVTTPASVQQQEQQVQQDQQRMRAGGGGGGPGDDDGSDDDDNDDKRGKEAAAGGNDDDDDAAGKKKSGKQSKDGDDAEDDAENADIKALEAAAGLTEPSVPADGDAQDDGLSVVSAEHVDPGLNLLRSTVRTLGFTPMWAVTESDDAAPQQQDGAIYTPGYPGHAGVLVGGGSDEDIAILADSFLPQHPRLSPSDAGFIPALAQSISTTAWAAIDTTAGKLSLPLFAPSLHAGLALGDTVTHVDGAAVRDPVAFRAALHARLPGDAVRLTVLRGADGSEETVTVEVAAASRKLPQAEVRRQRARLELPPFPTALLARPEEALAQLARVPRTLGFTVCESEDHSVAAAPGAVAALAAAAAAAPAVSAATNVCDATPLTAAAVASQSAGAVGGLGLFDAHSAAPGASGRAPLVAAAQAAVAANGSGGIVVQTASEASGLQPGDVILAVNGDPLLAASPAALLEALAYAHAPAAGDAAAGQATAVSAQAPYMLLPGESIAVEVMRFPASANALPQAMMVQAVAATMGGGAGAAPAARSVSSDITVLTVNVLAVPAAGVVAKDDNTVGLEWVDARRYMAGRSLPVARVGVQLDASAATGRKSSAAAGASKSGNKSDGSAGADVAAAAAAAATADSASSSGSPGEAAALLKLKAAGASLGFAAAALSGPDGGREVARMIEAAQLHRAVAEYGASDAAAPANDAVALFSDGGAATSGVLVSFVEPFGSAAQASLQTGDLVTHLNEAPVESPDALARFLRSGCVAGDTVHVTAVRALDGRVQELYLEAAPIAPLAQKDVRALRKTAGLPVAETAWYNGAAAAQTLAALAPTLGAELATVGNPEEEQEQGDSVVVVDSVFAPTATASGLRSGDVVVKLGSYRLRSADELQTIVASKRPGDGLLLTVSRSAGDGQEEVTVSLTLAGLLDVAAFPSAALAAAAAAAPVLPVTRAMQTSAVVARAFSLGSGLRAAPEGGAIVDAEAVLSLRRMTVAAAAEARRNNAAANGNDDWCALADDGDDAAAVPTVAALEQLLSSPETAALSAADRAAAVLARLPRSLGVTTRRCSEGLAVVALSATSPACAAGIVAGDVITHLHDARVSSSAALADALQAQHELGDVVTLRVLRNADARPEVITVQLGTLPGALAEAFPLARIQELRETAGMPPALHAPPALRSATDAEVELHALVPSVGVKLATRASGGVTIERLKPQGPADLAGLRDGDVIIGVGKTLLLVGGEAASETFRAEIKQTLPGDFVALLVLTAAAAEEILSSAGDQVDTATAAAVAATARAVYLEVSCGLPGAALSLDAVRALRLTAGLPVGVHAKREAVRRTLADACEMPANKAEVFASVAGFGAVLTSDSWLPRDADGAATAINFVIAALPVSIGASLVPVTLTPDAADAGATAPVTGLQVILISPFGGAAQAELTEGDVIVAVNGITTHTLSQLNSAIRDARAGDNVAVTVRKAAGGDLVADVPVEVCVDTNALFDTVAGGFPLPYSTGDDSLRGLAESNGSRRPSGPGSAAAASNSAAGLSEGEFSAVLSTPPQSIVRGLLSLLPGYDEDATRALLTPEHARATLSALSATVDMSVTVATTKLPADDPAAYDDEAAAEAAEREVDVLVVDGVEPDSVAAAAGVQVGDLLLAVNGVEFISNPDGENSSGEKPSMSDELSALLHNMTPGDPLVIEVQRNDSGERVVLSVPTAGADNNGTPVAASTVLALRRIAGFAEHQLALSASQADTSDAATAEGELDAEARSRAIALLSRLSLDAPLISDAGVPLVDLDALAAQPYAAARAAPPTDAARALALIDRLRPDLGMTVSQVDGLAHSAMSAFPATSGALVKVTSTHRAGSAAAATVVPGDLISMISGRVIESVADYRAAVASLTPGVVVEVEVRRGADGRVEHLHLEPGCTQPAAFPLARIRELRAAARLPVVTTPLLDAAAAREAVKALKVRLGMNVALRATADGGASVVVNKVFPMSNAAAIGMQPGFALLSVISAAADGSIVETHLRSEHHLFAMLNAYAPGDMLSMRVQTNTTAAASEAGQRVVKLELEALNVSREYVRSIRFIAGLSADDRA